MSCYFYNVSGILVFFPLKQLQDVNGRYAPGINLLRLGLFPSLSPLVLLHHSLYVAVNFQMTTNLAISDAGRRSILQPSLQ